jgi:pimeloyl-ACP methyl ester carboxylesterase
MQDANPNPGATCASSGSIGFRSEAIAKLDLLQIGDIEIAFERLGRAGPVIVFESGLGNDMRSWEEVTRQLAAFGQLVLYDRPGIGSSGPRQGTGVVLASTVADELLGCLRN